MNNLKFQKEETEEKLAKVGEEFLEIEKDLAEFKGKKQRAKDIKEKDQKLLHAEKKELEDNLSFKERVAQIDKRLEDLHRELEALEPIVNTIGEQVLSTQCNILKLRSIDLKEKNKMLTLEIALVQERENTLEEEIKNRKEKESQEIREKMHKIKFLEKQLESDIILGKINYHQYMILLQKIQIMKEELEYEIQRSA